MNHTILKTSSLTAAVALFPVASIFAGTETSEQSHSQSLSEWERSLPSSGASGSSHYSSSDNVSEYEFGDSDFSSRNIAWRPSIEVEILGASPTKDTLYGTKVDRMTGINLKVLANRPIDNDFSLDLYVLGGASYGEGEYMVERGDSFYRYSLGSEYGMNFMELSLGANIRWHLKDSFSLYAGARLGGGMLYVEDANYNSDPGFGLAYGVGFGLQWSINNRHALTLGYAFVGSTAKSKIEETFARESVTVESQSFNTLSLGYKYSF